MHRNIKVTSRFELQSEQDGNGATLKNIFKEPGYLWSLRSSATLSQHTRITLNAIIFSGKSFRFYHYEPDVPGVLTIKQLNGEGERISILVSRSWKLSRVSMKFGLIHFPGQNFIGSGNSRIDKNISREFSVQWDIKL